jgi:hypothetical protein
VAEDTSVPNGASHLLVYTTDANGTEHEPPVAMEFLDAMAFSAPASITFTDTNSNVKVIEGELAVGRSSSTNIQSYKVVWGVNATMPLGVCMGVAGYKLSGLSDCSGHGHDLSPFAAPMVDGHDGLGMLFDGTWIAEAASTAQLYFTNFTVMAWIKPAGIVTSWTKVIGKGYNLGLWLKPCTGQTGGQCFAAGITTSDGFVDCQGNGVPIVPGDWTNIAATYEVATASTGTLTAYVNAVEVAQCEVGIPVGDGEPIALGGSEASNKFQGVLDEVLFDDRVLHVSVLASVSPLAELSGSGDPLTTYISETAVPPMVTHMLAYASRDGALLAPAYASTNDLDYGVPTVSPGGVTFQDDVPWAGIAAGEVNLTRASSELSLDRYRLYYGTSAVDKVPGSTYVVEVLINTLPPVSAMNTITLPVMHPAPAGASHILAYSAYGFTECETPVSAAVSDVALPAVAPVNLTFDDTDMAWQSISGTVELTRPDDEAPSWCESFPGWVESGTSGFDCAYYGAYSMCTSSGGYGTGWSDAGRGGLEFDDYANMGYSAATACCQCGGGWTASGAPVVGYNVYFGDESGTRLGLAATGSVTGTTGGVLSMQIQPGTLVPPGTFGLMAFAVGDQGEAMNFTAVAPADRTLPAGILFRDINGVEGQFGGTITVQRAASEVGMESYMVYWASGGAPLMLLEELSLTVTATEEVSIHMSDSYGDGWNGAYWTVYSADGSFSQTGTLPSGNSDITVITGMQSGLEYTIEVGAGSYPSEITWELHYGAEMLLSGPAQDVQTFTLPHSGGNAGETFSTISCPMPPGATASPQVTQLLALAKYMDGSISSSGVSVSLADFYPPANPPASVSFQDTDGREGYIAGDISLTPASGGSATTYTVYFGSSATEKVGPAYSPGLTAEFFIVSQGSFIGAPPVGALDGLTPDVTRTDSMIGYSPSSTQGNYHFNLGGPVPEFAARWTGFVQIESAGSYTFEVTSADGCRLMLDGVVVLDNDGLVESGTRTANETLDLEAQIYPLKLEFFTVGNGAMILRYAGPDTNGQMQVLSDALMHDGSGVALIGNVSAGTSPLVIALSGTAVPSTATHLLAFSATAGGESLQSSSTPLVDAVTALAPPSNVAFTDVDPLPASIGGTVTFERASDESTVNMYYLYLGYSETGAIVAGSGAALANVSTANMGTSTYGFFTISQVSTTGLMGTYSHLVVVSAFGAATMSYGAGVRITDFAPPIVVAPYVQFTDTDSSFGEVGGTVTIGAASDEAGLWGYVVYWGESATTKLQSGEDGLNAAFYYRTTSTCTTFPTSSVTPDVTRADLNVNYPWTTLAWSGLAQSSDFAARWTGKLVISQPGTYLFELAVSGSAGILVDGYTVLTHTAVNFQDPATGGRSLAAGYHDIEITYMVCCCASGLRVSYRGPDTANLNMVIPSSVLKYNVAPLSQVAAQPVGGSEHDVTVSETIPLGATHFLVYTRDTSGMDSIVPAATTLEDYIAPSYPPSSVNFTDVNPEMAVVSGIVTIVGTGSQDTTHYNVYWGTSSSDKLTCRRLQEVISSPTKPKCGGKSCGSIQIAEEADGAWLVSRGSYGLLESAEIFVPGPGMINITRLSTEPGRDLLAVGKARFSGRVRPTVEIPVPEGGMMVAWTTDFSSNFGGWEFRVRHGQQLGSHLSSRRLTASSCAFLGSVEAECAGGQTSCTITATLEIASQSLPAGVSHILVYSAYIDEELSTPASTAVTDFNPPSLLPRAVVFEDENPALGTVAGSVIIVPYANTQGVFSYNVYWGTDESQSALLANVPVVGTGNQTWTMTERSLPEDITHLYVYSVGAASRRLQEVGPSSRSSISAASNPPVVRPSAPLRELSSRRRGTGTSTTTETTTTETSSTDTSSTETSMTAPTPPPTSPVPDPNWSVTGPCSSDGRCVSSPNHPSNYANNQYCSFEGPSGTIIETEAFATETYFDRLIVNGVTYTGTSGPPDGTQVTGSITWTSDYSVTRTGWKLCATGGSPSPPSPPSPPTTSFNPPSPVPTTTIQTTTEMPAPSPTPTPGESLEYVKIPLLDRTVPPFAPRGIYFEDTDPASGTLGGELVVTRAASEDYITAYRVFWGSSPTETVQLFTEISVNSTGGGDGGGPTCGAKGPDTTPLTPTVATHMNGPKIVNGQDATPCEWKWQAALRTTAGFSFCGGSLVSPRWVFSAAHCVQSGTSNMVIVVGDYNKDSSSDQFEATYTVARVISHPGYNSGTMDNDFALIELTEDVVMNECVGTVCLPEEDVEDQTMCYITGWGTLSSGGSTPSILQEGLVGVVSNADCNTRYNGEILDSMLCAQGSATGGIVDACQGDSGGPLVCEGAPGAYVLHGATSWGYGCAQAQYPGVWARVWYVMDWVNSYVTDAGTGGPSLPSNITTEVSGAMPPQGATHLLAFSVWGQDMNMTPAALEFFDYAPLLIAPGGVQFTDSDASVGEIGGTITVSPASTEEGVSSYKVYFGSSETTRLTLIGEASPNGGNDVTITVPLDTLVPEDATHLLAYVFGSGGLGASAAATPLVDWDNTQIPGGIAFEDMDPGEGTMGGTVTIQGAIDTSGLNAYNIYWGGGANCEKLNMLGQVTVDPGQITDPPQCTSGATCSLITISQEASGGWTVSRGMSGYQNNELATMTLEGPGIVSFNAFSTESSYDFLTFWDGISLSGTSLPNDITVPAGTNTVTWDTDFSVTASGWSFTFSADRRQDYVTYNISQGTTPSAGATHILVFSQTTAGQEVAGCAYTEVTDYSPPGTGPGALYFTDTDMAPGVIGGVMTITQAQDQDDIDEYAVFWGSDPYTLLSGLLEAVAVVPKNTAVSNVTATITGVTYPSDANYLIAFARGSGGTSPLTASTALVDYAPADDMAQAVEFTDIDPTLGLVEGAITITRAESEASVAFYNVYWSAGPQKISLIESVPSVGEAAEPTCTGTSCNYIGITPVTGGSWQITRGTSGYTDNEAATIALEGPATLSFTFFGTESGFDFVTVLGTQYSGSSMPPDTFIPDGSHANGIVWTTDGSVQVSGWTCVLSSGGGNTMTVDLNSTTFPSGATDVLVLTAGLDGAEMTQGIYNSFMDFAPPQVLPGGVAFEDTDVGIGFIGGTVTIQRATDETSVTSYIAMWGSDATTVIEGSTPIFEVPISAGGTGDITYTIEAGTQYPDVAPVYMIVYTAGTNGVSTEGISIQLVDATGLTISPTRLDIVARPGETKEVSIDIFNQDVNAVTLDVSLLFQSSDYMNSYQARTPPKPAPAPAPPPVCAAGKTGKNRVLFKHKGSAEGRRLHARRLQEQFPGVIVHEYIHLNKGLAYAELPDDKEGKSHCALMSSLGEDAGVEYVEDDSMVYPLGGNPIRSALFEAQKLGVDGIFNKPKHAVPKCAPGEFCGRTNRSQVFPNDPRMDDLWGMHNSNDIDIDAPEAWAVHTGANRQIIVAVIDTGVDYTHPELQNQMWYNPGEIPGNGIDDDNNGYVDDVHGYNFQGNSGDPMDDDGHGTHCAGTIGGEANNAEGVAGVTWGPQIMALKFLGSSGGTTSDAIRAVDYAVEMGAHLTSNSWGGGGFSQALFDAIQAADEAGQLFIVAAGNDGSDNDASSTYPCVYDVQNIICVASITSTGAFSSFSNWGATTVHIAAPGSDIVSSVPGGGYSSYSGTSMACPHVAGVATLVWDYVPTLDHMELKSIIMRTGDEDSRYSGQIISGARVNAHQALLEAGLFSWIRLSDPQITVPGRQASGAPGTASLGVRLGGDQLLFDEYQGSIVFATGPLTRFVPVTLMLHNYTEYPPAGAESVDFVDTDMSQGTIGGALTIVRAAPEDEEFISQYLVYWANASQTPISWTPFAALDAGSILRDEFESFDEQFWFPPSSSTTGYSYAQGFLQFSGEYPSAHLTYARQLAAPFTITARVRRSTSAFAGLVIQIGGSEVQLFGANGGVRAAVTPGHKAMIMPDGSFSTVQCSPSSLYSVTVDVTQTTITFTDDTGCSSLSASYPLYGPQNVVIGSHCTNACTSADWDFFQVTGGDEAIYNVPAGTAIPNNATGFVVYPSNPTGIGMNYPVYTSVYDMGEAQEAESPYNVEGSVVSATEVEVTWELGSLNDCAGSFAAYEVMAQGTGSWFAPSGCTSLVNIGVTSCTATGLESSTAFQFKVRVACTLIESGSDWSSMSPAVTTWPLPALRPRLVRGMVPTATTMLVTWQLRSLRDCEFIETIVEATTDTTSFSSWFRPAGCDSLVMMNAYTCTAQDLQPSTTYSFRVTTGCSDPLATSLPSEPSEPYATLSASNDVPPERLLAVKGVVETLPYVSGEDHSTLQAAIAASTARRLNVDVSKVSVQFVRAIDVDMRDDVRRRLGSKRALTSTSIGSTGTGFVIHVQEDMPMENATGLDAVVESVLSQHTGDSHSVMVHEVKMLHLAASPDGVAVAEGVEGTVVVEWSMAPLHDCAFLAYQVLVAETNDRGNEIFAPAAGCGGLLDMMATTCTAYGLTPGQNYAFKVQVLCANDGANSPPSAPVRLLQESGQCAPISPEDLSRLQHSGWAPRTCVH